MPSPRARHELPDGVSCPSAAAYSDNHSTLAPGRQCVPDPCPIGRSMRGNSGSTDRTIVRTGVPSSPVDVDVASAGFVVLAWQQEDRVDGVAVDADLSDHLSRNSSDAVQVIGHPSLQGLLPPSTVCGPPGVSPAPRRWSGTARSAGGRRARRFWDRRAGYPVQAPDLGRARCPQPQQPARLHAARLARLPLPDGANGPTTNGHRPGGAKPCQAAQPSNGHRHGEGLAGQYVSGRGYEQYGACGVEWDCQRTDPRTQLRTRDLA
jgi:hypothetical protein